MGRLFKLLFAALFALGVVSCTVYDDTKLRNDVDSLQDSISDLLSSVNAMEEDIEALQALVEALQNNVYVTSVVDTEDGYIIYFSDNTSVEIRDGEDGKDGESIFADISVEGDMLVIKLVDGTVIEIPMSAELWFNVTATDGVEAGKTAEFVLDSKGVEQFSVVKPVGWQVNVLDNVIEVTAPEQGLDYAEYGGTIDFIVTGAGKAIITKVPVYSYVWTEKESMVEEVLDFDGDYYLLRMADAGDNYGANFYNVPLDDEWSGLTFIKDEGYGVSFGLNESWGAYNLFGGAIVVSSSNNMEVADYTNQLSVYYKDPSTGKGGYNGSERFAVHYGYADESSIAMEMDFRTSIFFAYETKPVSMQVANATYPYIMMRDGSTSNDALNYENQGWFKIVVTAVDAEQTELGTAEYYLADFRTPSSPGLLEGWSEFDLSSLPECYALKINMEGSDVSGFGLRTPAYFCFDNLITKIPGKETVKEIL